jgi:hypothetical protein
MQVVSKLTAPYTGYTLEVKIDLADLPAAVDPARLGLNIFIYDSDTQDLTGQTRLGWSTFGGVQGDPYRWGHATLEGYTPPAGRSTTPREPTIPTAAAQSIDSPQSILQASRNGVGLAGDRWAYGRETAWIVSGPTVGDAGLTLSLRTRSAGTAHVFVWANGQTVASAVVTLPRRRSNTITVPLSDAARAAIAAGGALVLVGWQSEAGGTAALSAPISTGS